MFDFLLLTPVIRRHVLETEDDKSCITPTFGRILAAYLLPPSREFSLAYFYGFRKLRVLLHPFIDQTAIDEQIAAFWRAVYAEAARQAYGWNHTPGAA